MFKLKPSEERGMHYSSRVLIGNWFENSKLEEAKYNLFLHPLEKGELMLMKYRKMCENINAPTDLTRSIGTIAFGDKIALLAPHVPATPTHPSGEDPKGLLLGGRLSPDALTYTQDLHDGCPMVTYPDLRPREKDSFIITSKDYCSGELLKYNQEFQLILLKSVDVKPLYVTFDQDPIPGLCGKFPLYLSEHATSNTRWRTLPVQAPNITRFEQEGKPVPVNTDIIINHCATNINLGIDSGKWMMGFFGKNCAPLVKTCLDVHGCELPNNIWHIYSPS